MFNLLQFSVFSFALLSSTSTAAPHKGQRAGADQKSNGDSCTQQKKTKTATTGNAIYFLTNDAANAVVALPIGSDGQVSKGSITKTGGAGSNSVDATGAKAVPDALIGQSSLTVVGNHVFAVNAGSNSVSMLSISKADPTVLTMVGKPAAIPGEFPNTVAASAKNNLVCVGTTGAAAGISCAPFSAQGLGQFDCMRPFQLNQSTPPVGPTNTVSQTFFSADESTLFTTVKGDPAVNNTGFLSSFPVQQSGNVAQVSAKETRSSPDGTAVLFGSAVIPNDPSSLFVTDASFGGAVLSLAADNTATVKGSSAIDGQKATCWATVSPFTNSAFVTDVAVNHVVEMSLDNAKILGTLDLSANGDPGLIDLKAAGSFVYALSPGNGSVKAAVTVLDVSGGQGTMKQVQHFGLNGMAGANAQGMAVLL